jgi:hypothetical protein
LRNMMLFVTVATVIIAAMLIGVSRSRVNAMPVASSVDAVDTGAVIERGADTSASPSSAISSSTQTKAASTSTAKPLASVPSIGSVQVLNGCGVEGAAKRVTDFLRSKDFDVKETKSAPSFNYETTMVISRTADMGLAKGIGKLLKTDKVILMRVENPLYDVTVIVGPDYEEKIK